MIYIAIYAIISLINVILAKNIMDVFIDQIGQRLKTERKQRGWNQSFAAEKAGLARREISEIENGLFRGSILKVQQYAVLLGWSLSLTHKRRPTFDELADVFDEN